MGGGGREEEGREEGGKERSVRWNLHKWCKDTLSLATFYLQLVLKIRKEGKMKERDKKD